MAFCLGYHGSALIRFTDEAVYNVHIMGHLPTESVPSAYTYIQWVVSGRRENCCWGNSGDRPFQSVWILCHQHLPMTQGRDQSVPLWLCARSGLGVLRACWWTLRHLSSCGFSYSPSSFCAGPCWADNSLVSFHPFFVCFYPWTSLTLHHYTHEWSHFELPDQWSTVYHEDAFIWMLLVGTSNIMAEGGHGYNCSLFQLCCLDSATLNGF